MTFWDQVVANPRFWLSAAVLLGVTAIECLLALWAATAPPKSRLPRVAIAWLAIVLLVPIRAHEPALLFAAVAVDLIVLFSAIRFLTRERAADESRWSGWHRFSVADICVLTLLVGTVLGLGLRMRAPPYLIPVVFLGAVPLVLVTCASYYAVVERRRHRALVLLVAALISFAPLRFGSSVPFLSLDLGWPSGMGAQDMTLLGPIIFLAWLVTYLGRRVWMSRHHPMRSWQHRLELLGLAVATTALGFTLWYFHGTVSWTVSADRWRLPRTLYHALPLASLAALIAAATALARVLQHAQRSAARRAASGLAGGLAAIIGLPLAWLYCQMLYLPPLPSFPSESPTNYDRLAAIARQLQLELQPPRYRSPLPASATALLEEASLLLEAPNYVPVEAVERETAPQTPDSAFSYQDMFAIVGAYRFAATDAQSQKKFDLAADQVCNLLRFGTMLQRGGTHHTVMGRHMHVGAFQIIREFAPQVSRQKRRDIIRTLDDFLQQREDPTVQARRGLATYKRTSSWQSRFSSVIADLFPLQLINPAAYDEGIRHELAVRAMQLELAIIDFDRDHARRPAALEELVPDYLRTVPLDPFSGRPLQIRTAENDSYALYSVGHDGIDNGGNFASDMVSYYNQTGYDLKLP